MLGAAGLRCSLSVEASSSSALNPRGQVWRFEGCCYLSASPLVL